MSIEYLKVNIYDTRNNLILASTQCSVNEEEETIVVTTDKTDLFEKFQFVRVELLTDQGVQQAEGFVRLIVMRSQVSIALAKFEGEVEERRQFLKVPCEIQQDLLEVQVNGQEIKFEKPVPIIVRNISLGGMLFSSPALLELGTRGQITFMEGKRPCYLFFNIVRVEDYSTPEKEKPAGEIYDYRYGCQFEMLSDDAETALCGFVFQEDAIRRRKKKYQYLD